MSLASGMSFSRLVSHVIFNSTKPKMVRIHTRRVIALVADTHTTRYVSVMELPRDPMCSLVSTFIMNHPVTVVVFSCGPQPTLVRPLNLNLLPKPLHSPPPVSASHDTGKYCFAISPIALANSWISSWAWESSRRAHTRASAARVKLPTTSV